MLSISIHASAPENAGRFNRLARLDIVYQRLSPVADYKVALLERNSDPAPPRTLAQYPRWSSSLWDLVALFGTDGLSILGGKSEDNSGGSGIGVNSFLWRAELDTISFMPLASADPFGGTIITDWYSPAETPNERFKLNVFILDKQLRSDGVSVKVFRQNLKGGSWRDSTATDTTARQLEEAILTRARQMRVGQLNREDD